MLRVGADVHCVWIQMWAHIGGRPLEGNQPLPRVRSGLRSSGPLAAAVPQGFWGRYR